MSDSTCPGCGAAFSCGVQNDGPCWCMRLPALPSVSLPSKRGCLCPACLRAKVEAPAPVDVSDVPAMPGT